MVLGAFSPFYTIIIGLELGGSSNPQTASIQASSLFHLYIVIKTSDTRPFIDGLVPIREVGRCPLSLLFNGD